MALPGERRKRQRLALHWPVRLFSQRGRASVESITENLSTEGLYCISTKPFKTGERLRCEIVIPEALGLDAPIMLECHVIVRRVEYLRSGFGVGCHIEDYALSSGGPTVGEKRCLRAQGSISLLDGEASVSGGLTVNLDLAPD